MRKVIRPAGHVLLVAAFAAALLLPGTAHPADNVTPPHPHSAGTDADDSADEADAAHGIDVKSYHYTRHRTGWNKRETVLTQANVASSSFGLLHKFEVDDDVLAQPLFISGFRMPDGSTHDVLVVVTENNSVYAFDADDYSTLWHSQLGEPQKAEDVGCSHVHPRYGISATPVIVRSAVDTATLYVVSATEPEKHDFHTYIVALNLADGHQRRPPVEIEASKTLSDGSTLRFLAADNWIRAGMAVSRDSIYLAASSHCDNNGDRTAGWLIRYDFDLHRTGSFATIDTPAGNKLAAFWAAGFAPALDKDGSVFAVTGNGNFAKGGKDWGESVIRVSADLKGVVDYFTPAAYKTLTNFDLDFGSGGVMLLPTPGAQQASPLAVAMGKDAVLYLLDRTNLGKVAPGDSGALQAQRLEPRGSGVWGGPAYFEAPTRRLVYYQTSGGVLQAFALEDGATPSLTLVASGTTISSSGSLPIVSSDGSKPGTGIVWNVRRRQPPELEAYDAERLGAPLFSAKLPPWNAGAPYLTAMVANGRVYVGTSKTVSVFGLAP
jgi:outer membrane protein assembly factor BamB